MVLGKRFKQSSTELGKLYARKVPRNYAGTFARNLATNYAIMLAKK